MHLVGVVARYHRKAPPSTLHHEFAQLTLTDRHRVRVLAGILRSPTHWTRNIVRRFATSRSIEPARRCICGRNGIDDVLLEQWALQKKDDLFREVFGLTWSS